jgi:DNA-binding XRE family transcriptional regulator
MSLKDLPFLARRARLLSGMKQEAFAEDFGVDVSTVSRWERGKLRPNAKTIMRLQEIVLRSQSLLSDEVIKASSIFKYVAPVNDLTHPCVLSKGITEALYEAGIKQTELRGDWWHDMADKSHTYDISSVKALDMIEADPDWRAGRVAYAESHCFAPKLLFWTNLMVAPLPDRSFALIESVRDPKGEAGGFAVRLHRVEDLAKRPVPGLRRRRSGPA